MSPYLAAAIVFVVACSDALRDRWVSRQVGWWQWHIIKWLAFYPPLVALVVLFVPKVYWAPLAAICMIAWRVIYRYKM